MIAISIRQPFASQIASGEKSEEYRTWTTKHRGALLVCAARARSREAVGLPLGVAVCVVDLHDVTGAPGEFVWHLRNPRPVEPFPVKGKLGFFHIDDELVRVQRDASAVRLRAPERRSRPGPYTFAIRDRKLPGLSAATPAEAAEEAYRLAVHHGAVVWIRRDGFDVKAVGPEDAAP